MSDDEKPRFTVIRGGSGEHDSDGVSDNEEKDGASKPPPRSTAARARVSVADRVDAIARMMERGEWVRGVSGPLLAEQWGTTVSEVKRAAAEASRRVRMLVDADAVRVRIAGALDRALDAAEQQDDPKAVAAVAKVYGPLVGAVAPTRIEVDHSLPRWLPADLVSIVDELPRPMLSLSSPPTDPEWDHVIEQMSVDECTLEVCRVHGRGLDDGILDGEVVDDD